MTSRYRQNFLSGSVPAINTTGQLTITGTGFPSSMGTGQYMAITLNPGYYGGPAAGEIVYIGPGTTNTVAQVLARAQEGTTAITGTNIPWVAGPTYTDFDVTNLTSTGTLTLTNGLTVSGGTSLLTNGLTVSGGTSLYGTTNLYGTTVASGITISGNWSTISGNVSGLTASGITVLSGTNVNISGTTISGIPMARISASGQTIIYPASSVGYQQVGNLFATTGYGYVKNGCISTYNTITVPIAGYYHIDASIGWHTSNSDPNVAGVYGLQVSYTGGYLVSNAYLINGSSGGTDPIVPETIVAHDLVYLAANATIYLFAWNPSSVNQAVGGVAGQETTYLSVYYVGS